MRREGTLQPPRPRAPAAARQAPPFVPREGQVFRIDSPLRTRQLGRHQVFPGREEISGREEKDGRHSPGTSRV